MLINASVTESLANFATHLINHAGYGGVAILIGISSLVILPGTEVTMLFGGFSVDQHHLTLFGLVSIASIVDILGGIVVYWIAYFGAVEVLERLPGPLNVSSHGLDRAHAWIERWGVPAMIVSRLVPTVRAGGPWAAGVSKMPFWRYLFSLIVGTVIWMLALGLIGKAVGDQWPKWKSHLDIVDYIAVAFVAALIVWFIYEKLWKPRVEARAQADIDA
jgi:membrane protein DedA with SNARE-associated domain